MVDFFFFPSFVKLWLSDPFVLFNQSLSDLVHAGSIGLSPVD